LPLRGCESRGRTRDKNNKLITLNPPTYKQRRSARDEGQRRRLLRIEKERERERDCCVPIILFPYQNYIPIPYGTVSQKKKEIDIYPNTF
jgi:hypothetical protein